MAVGEEAPLGWAITKVVIRWADEDGHMAH